MNSSEKVIRGKQKGAVAYVIPYQIEDLLVIVEASDRVVGRFVFVKELGHYVLYSELVVEREFFPFELALDAIQTVL